MTTERTIHHRDPDAPRLTTLILERPRCPRCGSPELEVRRTIDQGDGSRLRYCRCRRCSRPVRVVVE